jgi:hypothetical protein
MVQVHTRVLYSLREYMFCIAQILSTLGMSYPDVTETWQSDSHDVRLYYSVWVSLGPGVLFRSTLLHLLRGKNPA